MGFAPRTDGGGLVARVVGRGGRRVGSGRHPKPDLTEDEFQYILARRGTRGRSHGSSWLVLAATVAPSLLVAVFGAVRGYEAGPAVMNWVDEKMSWDSWLPAPIMDENVTGPPSAEVSRREAAEFGAFVGAMAGAMAVPTASCLGHAAYRALKRRTVRRRAL